MLNQVSRIGALALPAGILTLIALMVVPIPAVMLDVFFVFNIALSVAVLMAAISPRSRRCCCLRRCCACR
jgi:flagellar biosynthesis protein FlhA